MEHHETDNSLSFLVSQVDCGKEPLEDLVGQTENAAWIIDGATGLTEKEITDAESDGVWFVETFNTCLKNRIDNLDSSLTEIIQACIAETRTRFQNVGCENIEDPLLEPAGAISLVRERDGKIEYLVLGDCSIVNKLGNTDVEVVLGEGPRKLDGKVVEKMKHLIQEDGLSYETAYCEVQPMLKEHRRMKNTPAGYWTLGFDQKAVLHAVTGEFSIESTTKLYLFSDGFEHLVSTYDVFSDWTAATNYIDHNGVDRAFRLLRDIERGDPECYYYPRLKPMDDAALSIIATGDEQPNYS